MSMITILLVSSPRRMGIFLCLGIRSMDVSIRSNAVSTSRWNDVGTYTGDGLEKLFGESIDVNLNPSVFYHMEIAHP